MIVNDPDISYCFLPCGSPNIYWNKNNTCLSKCDSPYAVTSYSGVLECLPACKDSEYFYDQEGKRYSTCSSPYEEQLVDGLKVCHLDASVTLGETETILSKAEAIKAQGTYTSGAMKVSSAISSRNPASALLAGLSAMLQYIRYMKVNYPPKVQVLFLVSVMNPLSLGFDFEIPNYIEDRLVDYDLPYVFEKYDINLNFVNNLWDFLITLALVLLAIFVFFFLGAATSKFSKTNKVIAKVFQAMKWNTPLAMICGTSGDIFFYSSLQFMSSPLNSTASIACFVLCILMIVTVVALFIITLKIVKGFRLHWHRVRHGKVPEDEEWKEKWSNWEILFAEYEEKTLLSLGYMALFILRGAVFNLTIANLYNFPLTQSIIIIVANFFMYAYLLYLRPVKELLGLVQLFVAEGMVLIVSTCVLILAIMDKANINGQSTRLGIGDVMVFLIQAFNTFALVFMGISLLLFLVFAFKAWRALWARGIKSPFKMLEMILFEDLEAKKVEPVGDLTTSSWTSFASSPPKIHPLSRKEDLSDVNHGITLESAAAAGDKSLSDSSDVGRSRNNSRESWILATGSNLLRLKMQNQSAGEVEITNFDQEKSFFGVDQAVLEGSRIWIEVVLRRKVCENANEILRLSPKKIY